MNKRREEFFLLLCMLCWEKYR